MCPSSSHCQLAQPPRSGQLSSICLALQGRVAGRRFSTVRAKLAQPGQGCWPQTGTGTTADPYTSLTVRTGSGAQVRSRGSGDPGQHKPCAAAALQKSAFVPMALAVFFSFPRQSSGIFWILPFLPCPGRGGGGHHACRLHPCPCALASWGVEWRAVRPGRVDVPAGLRAMAGRRTSSQPLFPRQPQLLTEPLSPGRPSPRCRHPAGGWGRRSGLSQPSRAEKPPPRPFCGVIKLLAGLCPLPFRAQSTALVPVTTKGPYSPPSFISAGFGLTGSGCGDFYRNRAALPLTLRAQ